MNVFLITSPFQVLNAIEAVHHFNFTNNELIVLMTGLFKKSQYEVLMDKHHWQTVKYVPFPLPKRLIKYDFGTVQPRNAYERILELYLTFCQFEKRRRIDRLAESLGSVDNLVLGSYRSDYNLHFRHFANRVDCKNVYVVDIGTNTLDYERQADVTSKSSLGNEIGNMDRFTRFKKMIKNRYIDWDNAGTKEVKFFTCYDCDTSERNHIIKNEYKYLQSLMLKCSISDEVLFLGESLVDDGLISFEAYLACLTRIKKYFVGSDLIYVPHPRESEKYVRMIRNSMGFKVEQFSVPVEYALVTRGRKPKCIASFFSSALPNCSVIFGKSLIIKAFLLREDDVLKGNDMVNRIYSYYASPKNENIEVVFDY